MLRDVILHQTRQWKKAIIREQKHFFQSFVIQKEQIILMHKVNHQAAK